MADLKGLKEVEKNINEQLKNIKGDTTKGIQDVALDLLGKSVNLAPVDTGDLRGSGSVRFEDRTIAEGNEQGGTTRKGYIKKPIDNPVATIGFYVPYALRQHEDLSYNHPKGGQAKYLEEPMKSNTAKYIKHIQKKAEVD